VIAPRLGARLGDRLLQLLVTQSSGDGHRMMVRHLRQAAVRAWTERRYPLTRHPPAPGAPAAGGNDERDDLTVALNGLWPSCPPHTLDNLCQARDALHINRY
jgi:hypothetical protein